MAQEASRPPSSTLADRRRIADALDANYDAAAGCYHGDKSDAEISKLLNVPRAWVAQVRELTYGPDVSSEKNRVAAEMSALSERYDALMKEVSDFTNKGMDLFGAIDEARKKLSALQKGAA